MEQDQDQDREPKSPLASIEEVRRGLEMLERIRAARPGETARALVELSHVLSAAARACREGQATEGQLMDARRRLVCMEKLASA